MLISWWDDTSSFQLIFDKWEMYKEALYFFNDPILIGLCLLIWPLRVFRVQYIKKCTYGNDTGLRNFAGWICITLNMIHNGSGFISDAREISDNLSEAEQLQNFRIFVI